MLKFLGMNYYSFVPDGEKETKEGYSAWFTDDEARKNAIGLTPFKASFTPEEAASILRIRNPADIDDYVEHVGKPCEMVFNRKGKIQAIRFAGEA